MAMERKGHGENINLLDKDLVNGEAVLYQGEKEPDQKYLGFARDVVASGYPVDMHMSYVDTSARRPWSTGLCDCLINETEHHGDCEVCILGCYAPCVLHGTTRGRLDPSRNRFSSDCLYYGLLYVLGSTICKFNALAPCFSFPQRSEVRRKFNLEGHGERCYAQTGCCAVANEEQREKLETTCDCLVHYFCHECALCQEAREVRRHGPPAVISVPAPMATPPVQFMLPTQGRA